MSKLRDYMEKEFGGLKPDRDDESYALEFLQTGQANLKLAKSKVNLTIVGQQLAYFGDWVKDKLTELPSLIERVEKLTSSPQNGVNSYD